MDKTFEINRLRTLSDYRILDTEPEQCFDDLTTLAAQICGTTEAGISLVDRERLWFKSKVGFDVPEIPREGTLCEAAIGCRGMTVVADAAADPAFRDNIWVSGYGYRFYAAMPIVNPEGYVLGTLFVLDKRPREIDDRQRTALVALAKQAEAQFELRRKVITLERIIDQLEDYSHELLNSQERYRSVVDNVREVIFQIDADGRWLFLNPAWREITGHGVAASLGEGHLQYVHPRDRAGFKKRLDAVLRGARPDVRHELRYLTVDGGFRWVEAFAKKTQDESGLTTGLSGTLNDITERRLAEEGLKKERDYVSLLQSATAAANQAETLGEALQKCVADICELMGWQVGHVYTVGPVGAPGDDGRTDPAPIESTGIWYLREGDRFAEFVADTGVHLERPAEGLPGRTLEAGTAVWSCNLQQEEWFVRRPVATRLGLKSGFAFPVKVGDETVAVIEFFSTRLIAPDDKFLEVLSNVGLQLGRVVERQRASGEARRLINELADINLALDTSTIVAVTDRQGFITHVNDKFCAISGYTKAELIGRRHSVVNSGIHPRMFFDDMWNMLHLGHIWHGEMRNRGKDGNLYWVDTTIIPFLDDEGRPYQHIAISIDITKRKNFEEAVRESESRFRAISETSPLGVLMIDNSRRFVYVNERMHEMTGWLIKDLLGEDWTKLVHRDDVKRLGPAWRLGRRDHFNEEFRLVRRDGTEIWASVHSAPIRINGSIDGFVGLVEDITERKKMEQALRDSEARYRVVAETASDAIVTIDADSRIQFVNSAAEQIFGYHKSEMEGQSLAMLIPERLRGGHFAGAARYLETGERKLKWRGIEVPAIRKDGSEIIIEISFGEFRKEGRHSFTSIIRDITERKQIALELQQAKDAAEAATLAKSQFLANMSHEIRTPMNSIIGLTNLLLEAPLRPGQRDLLETVNYSAESLLTIINDILDFSKIEAGRLELETIDFDLRKTVRHVYNLFAETSLRDGNELTFEVAPELPAILRGDPVRLRQILTNLVGNAVKFTSGGSIAVRAELRSGTDDDVVAYFEVEDTGVGITEEQRARLFQAFSQADGSINRRFGGTGLGLAICRELTELMGGKIGCVSEYGRGSRFWFTARFGRAAGGPVLPEAADGSIAREIAEGRHRHGDAGAAAKDLRLLVADDNAINRKVALLMLESLGYGADVASNGREVLTALERATYDVILMDVQMPELDGLETTRRICAQMPPGNRPRIIAMTANALGADRDECREAGMDDYLSKPIRKNDLRDMLAKCDVVSASVSDPAKAPPAAPVEDTGGPIDYAMFKSLEEFAPDGAADIIGELISIFLEDGPRGLDKLRAAVAEGEPVGVERAAHALKGSCATIGAARAAAACARLERAAHDGDITTAAANFEAAADELDRALAALRGMLVGK